MRPLEASVLFRAAFVIFCHFANLPHPAASNTQRISQFLRKEKVGFLVKKIALITFSFLLFAGLASAQIPTSGNVFFGYSYMNTDLNTNSNNNANGWEASFEGKVFPFVGLVADFDGHYGAQSGSVCIAGTVIGGCSSSNYNFSEHNYLFGPRVSASIGKFRPFAEALFGASHISSDFNGNDTSFATAIGGGLDYKIVRPVAWRFQGDYVQTRFFSNTQNNFRLSTGIVVRF